MPFRWFLPIFLVSGFRIFWYSVSRTGVVAYRRWVMPGHLLTGVCLMVWNPSGCGRTPLWRDEVATLGALRYHLSCLLWCERLWLPSGVLTSALASVQCLGGTRFFLCYDGAGSVGLSVWVDQVSLMPRFVLSRLDLGLLLCRGSPWWCCTVGFATLGLQSFLGLFALVWTSGFL